EVVERMRRQQPVGPLAIPQPVPTDTPARPLEGREPVAHRDIERELRELASVEKELDSKYDVLFRKHLAGHLSPAALADAIETEILPAWSKARERLGAPLDSRGGHEESWKQSVRTLRAISAVGDN